MENLIQKRPKTFGHDTYIAIMNTPMISMISNIDVTVSADVLELLSNTVVAVKEYFTLYRSRHWLTNHW